MPEQPGPEDPDRRAGERRAEERRAHRRSDGRRDERAPERRQGWRRYLLPGSLLLALLLAWIGYRVGYVAPRAAAKEEVGRVALWLLPLLQRSSLPLMALPGTAGPEPGDPSIRPLPMSPAEATQIEDAAARLSRALQAAPRQDDATALLGTTLLLLDHPRAARLAFEQLLAAGDDGEQLRARIGLALVALRTGLRSHDEQDRSFAFEHALYQLAEVPAAKPFSADALFDRVVILWLLDREDEARRHLRSLARLPEQGARLLLLEDAISSEGELSSLRRRLRALDDERRARSTGAATDPSARPRPSSAPAPR